MSCSQVFIRSGCAKKTLAGITSVTTKHLSGEMGCVFAAAQVVQEREL